MCILQWPEKNLPSEELKPYQPRANYASHPRCPWVHTVRTTMDQGHESCANAGSMNTCHFKISRSMKSM